MKNEALSRYDKCIMQIYKALNRQYSKESAISVIGNLIYKNFGYRSMYFDIIEDNRAIIIKNLLGKYSNTENNLNSGVFNLKLPVDEYKKSIYLDDENNIKGVFPCLYEAIKPGMLLSTPVFSQNELIGIFIVYDIHINEMEPRFKDLVQLVSRELTAVFSRIERHNLAFGNVLGLTALENILLYNPEEDKINDNNSLQKIVSILPKTTNMKKCTLALMDEDKKYLISYSSGYDNIDTLAGKERYSLDKSKNKDHVAIIALETKKPLIIYDALTDSRCDFAMAKRLGVYSSITLPIFNVNNEPLGILHLHNGEYENFSKAQIRFLEIVAHHIGLIISNMNYIDDLKIWSKYDGLTGLFNRRAFEVMYDELCDLYKFNKGKFSILMIDIDDFKSTNDVYGHQIGDRVLQKVTKSIKRNIREKDIAARYGGEEIIIILKDIDKKAAKAIANRIRHSISLLSIAGAGVTVSIGISTFGVDSYNRKDLIYIADKCLYEAKNIGKNQVVCR